MFWLGRQYSRLICLPARTGGKTESFLVFERVNELKGARMLAVSKETLEKIKEGLTAKALTDPLTETERYWFEKLSTEGARG